MLTGCRITLFLVFMVCLSSCNSEQPDLLESIRGLFSTPARRAAEAIGSDEKSIEELEADLKRFESIIREKVEAAEGAVTLYKLLAEQYSELGMYDLALEQYEELLRIEPNNHVVLNSAGIAAGQTALSRPTVEEKQQYLERAQRYYERSIEIDPTYRDPYFGLGVLHLFEFEDIDAAKSLLNKAFALFPDDTRMLFLLARIAVLEERINDALEIYDRIVEKSELESEKNSALANREALLGSY